MQAQATTETIPKPRPRDPGLGVGEDALLAAVGTGPVSIDAIAAEVGVASVKEVRRLSLALEALAGRGLLECLGGGLWAAAGGGPPPAHATPDDVVSHGFGDGTGPATFQRIRRNVSDATGRSVSRLHETLAGMIASGLLERAREHCYVLTEAAVEADGRIGLAPDQERALAALAPGTRLRSDEVAAACGDDVRAVRATLRGLLALGLVRESRAGGRRVFEPGDPARMLAVRGLGPAARKALARMSVPVSYDGLAEALGVSRERARQHAARLVGLGLARPLPPSPGPALFVADPGAAGPGKVSMQRTRPQLARASDPTQ